MKKILPSLTTITTDLWKSKIEEIDKLNIEEIALFPTCLKDKQREELYLFLQKTKLKRIPFVHLRTDMEVEELEFLEKVYKCNTFNIHADEGAPAFLSRAKKYLNRIYVENLDDKSINKQYWEAVDLCAGVCLDFSHLYSYGNIRQRESYKDFLNKINKYTVGCGHFSSIRNIPINNKKPSEDDMTKYSFHDMIELSDFDYLAEFKGVIPNVCAIELENCLEEQLELKKYLENNLLKGSL